MDWVDDGGREPRGDARPPRKGMEDRLDGWMSRGRELVDGVAGTRPGARPGPAGRGRLEGVGRWVEGKLDWLLDDRDDWREPWQEGERPLAARGVEPPPPAPRRGRPPLEAISRRGVPSPEPPAAAPRAGSPPADPASRGRGGARQDWPEEETFTVARWRRPDPARPQPVDPLAGAPPASAPAPPGRPLPRSTRRR